MDIERVIVRMTADASQYLRVFDVVEARLVAFGGFLGENLVRSSMKLAMEFERMGIAFEVMTGSAEKGKAVLSEIMDLAVRSPFTSQELVKSAKQAMAFGFEVNDIIPVLSRLGDVSVATGSDMDRLILALGQVRTTGRLMGQELRQFTNAGVPILQYLAKAMGVAEAQVPQMVRMGAVGFNDVAKAFNLMTNAGGRFFGMMERTNLETVFGRWQNFTESVQIASRKIGEEMFKAFDVRTLLTDLTNWVGSIDLDKLRGQMEFVRDSIVAVWHAVVGVVKAVREWLDANPAVAKMLGLIIGIAAAFKAAEIALISMNVVLGVVHGFFRPLLWVASALLGVIMAMAGPIATVVATFLGAATPLALLTKIAIVGTAIFAGMGGNVQWVGKTLNWLGKTAGEVVTGIASAVADLFVGIVNQAARTAGRLIETFAGLGDIFKTAFSGMFDAFAAGNSDLGFDILFRTLQFGFKAFVEWMKVEMGLAWNEIFINVTAGLKRALVNALVWFNLKMESLFDFLPGSAARVRAFNATRATAMQAIDADQQKDLAAAALESRKAVDDLIRSLRGLGDADVIRDRSGEARIGRLLGADMQAMIRDALGTMLAPAGTPLPIPKLEADAFSGIIPVAALQAQFEDLWTKAARQLLEFYHMETERARGVEPGFGRGIMQLARTSQAWDALKQFEGAITNSGVAARRAAAEISKAFEITAETRAWLLDLSKDFAKGATAFDTFQRQMGMWEEAVVGPWRTRDRAAAAMGGLGAAAFVGRSDFAPAIVPGSDMESFALNQVFEKLQRSVPNPADRRPPAAVQGTREAAEIIGRAQSQTVGVQEQIRSVLIQSYELHRQQVEYQRQVATEMRRALGGGEIVPLPVKPN